MLHFTKNLCKELKFQFFFNFLKQISKFSQRFRKQLCFWSEHEKSKCRPFQFLLKFLLMQFGHFLKKPFVNDHNFSGLPQRSAPEPPTRPIPKGVPSPEPKSWQRRCIFNEGTVIAHITQKTKIGVHFEKVR